MEWVILFLVDMVNWIGCLVGEVVFVEMLMMCEDIVDYFGFNIEMISWIFIWFKKSKLV